MTKATRMLTINEAAERVPGLSKWRIREMCISGELPHIKAGKKYLINEQVLVGYLTGTGIINSYDNQNQKAKGEI